MDGSSPEIKEGGDHWKTDKTGWTVQTAAAPTPFLFSLPGATPQPTPKPTSPNEPEGELTLKETQDASVIFSTPLASLPETYFEITIKENPGVVAIGLGLPSFPLAGQLPGWQPNSYGYHSDDGRFHVAGEDKQIQKGTKRSPFPKTPITIGCGLNSDGKLFFMNGPKCLEPTEKIDVVEGLYPLIGGDTEGIVISYNMKAPNPHKAGKYLFGIKFKPAWFDDLGDPLGTLDFKKVAQPQTCKLSLIPPDILKLLVPQFKNCKILETCRAFYEYLRPYYKWFQIHDSRKLLGTKKYFVDEHKSNVTKSQSKCYTHYFILNEDGTFESRQAEMPTSNYDPDSVIESSWTGKWRLKYDFLPDADSWDDFPGFEKKKVLWLEFENWVLKRSKGGKKASKDEEQPKLVGTVLAFADFKEKTEKEFKTAYEAKHIPFPTRRRMMRKCGVPLEQQVSGVDCCHEVVEEIVDSVWNEGLVTLGDDIKKAITARISAKCMMPPGMTDFELRVAVAEELANADEWNECFQSAKSFCT